MPEVSRAARATGPDCYEDSLLLHSGGLESDQGVFEKSTNLLEKSTAHGGHLFVFGPHTDSLGVAVTFENPQLICRISRRSLKPGSVLNGNPRIVAPVDEQDRPRRDVRDLVLGCDRVKVQAIPKLSQQSNPRGKRGNKGKPCLALNLSRHDISHIREGGVRDDGAKFGDGGGGKKCRCSSVGRTVDADSSCLESLAEKEIDRSPNVPPLEPAEPDAVAPGAPASSQVKDEHMEAGLHISSRDVGVSAGPAVGIEAVNKHNYSIT